MTAVRALMGALFGSSLALLALLLASAGPVAIILLPYAWILVLIFIVPFVFLVSLPAAAVLDRVGCGRGRYFALACGLGIATALAILLGLAHWRPGVNLAIGLLVAWVGGAGLGIGAAIVATPRPIPVAEEMPPSPREFFATAERRRDRVLFGKFLVPGSARNSEPGTLASPPVLIPGCPRE